MFFDRIPVGHAVGAHRGARSLAPENTLLAAQAGLAARAHFWELDVQRSADGALVVLHDDTLARTTDIRQRPEFAARAPWPVRAFTLAELRTLDAGSWFAAADPFGTIARGRVPRATLAALPYARIPTLAEALEFSRDRDFPVNVELKAERDAPFDHTLAADVLAAVRAARAQSLVLVSSFDHRHLAALRRLDPALPTGALFGNTIPPDLLDRLAAVGAAACHPKDAAATDSLVRSLAAAGLRTLVWTVNDPARAHALAAAGATGVFTDFPQDF